MVLRRDRIVCVGSSPFCILRDRIVLSWIGRPSSPTSEQSGAATMNGGQSSKKSYRRVGGGDGEIHDTRHTL